MNRIKDFIYDKNDLLVALMIVALATFIIVLRVDVIMAYPSSSGTVTDSSNTENKPPLSEEISMGGSHSDGNDDETDGNQEGNETEGELIGEENSPEKESPGQDDAEQAGQNHEENDQPKPELPKPENPAEGEGLVSIYIKSGSTGSDIAKLLINAGLIKSREEFYDAVRAAGADTRLQAGNFKIPANASPEEIVKIITR